MKALVVAGILMIPIGPLARMNNEGFGGPPGPIAVSYYRERVSYLLMPTGAGIAVFAAVLLVVIDGNRSQIDALSDRNRKLPDSHRVVSDNSTVDVTRTECL